MDNLRETVMINQFVAVTGCSRDQAPKILGQAGWQFQTALSIFFQEAVIPKNTAGFSLLTPSNTPATPPNFPEALNMFSSMSTSDSSSRMVSASPGSHANTSLSPRGRGHLYPSSRCITPSMGVNNAPPNPNTADCQFQIDNNYIASSNSMNNTENGVLKREMR
eukprot:TRINITY_DN6511_c0_g1_i1.p1 TRINITY_DN6511_c0_g1~~TRINITY_DN6511_c0_g1_i1.p1  ORF type:complete len:164 (+),score=10.56 TRINITY_DN6511_c0_g1_i1:216-707(+)